MKLSELKIKLEKNKKQVDKNCNINLRNKELEAIVSKDLNESVNYTDLDDICIIGVTGSKGKSTVCCLIHDYLKYIGETSILYSSIKIDSPSSNKRSNKACEVALSNEDVLLELIKEAEVFKPNFLVLEINESTIEKGIIDDLDFDLKVLTNIYPKNSFDVYSDLEYVNLKKSFFKNINENCKCVIGMVEPFTREEFNDILRLNNNPKFTYSTKYYCNYHNANDDNVDVLAFSKDNKDVDSLNGLDFYVRVNGINYNIKTKMIMPHNIFNICSVICCLDSINVLDMNKFLEFIKFKRIDEREHLIKVQDRYIIIGMSLMPHLEIFNKYKENGQVKKLKLVIGSVGENFKTWENRFNSEKRKKEISNARKTALEYASKYMDYIYITSNDPASTEPLLITNELKSYINKSINEVVVDRKEAIRKAIFNSNIGDLIYISGRANRENFCISENEMILFKDLDIVNECLYELGWSKC